MEQVFEKAGNFAQQYLPDILKFGLKVILCIAVYFIGKKVIDQIVRVLKRALERARVQVGVITFTASITKITLYVVLILGIGSQFGLQESSVAAIVASGGVAIGLALQGGLSNLAGGFLILLFQPFRVGDYIITQGEEGTVSKIEILYTTLQSVDNRRIIVPNGNLANNVIVNVTGSDRRQLEVKVGISYRDNIQKAKEILGNLMEQDGDVLGDRDKQVFVDELAESSVVIGMRCWVMTENYQPVRWRMNERIKEEFDQAGLTIPFPQREIWIQKPAGEEQE